MKEQNGEENKTENINEISEVETPIANGVSANEHSLYKKFFKMLQVGVPLRAVQLKMQSEGLDTAILK